MINQLIEKKCGGNAGLVGTTQAKLIMKGIFPDRFNENSPDDEAIIAKIKEAATEMGVNL